MSTKGLQRAVSSGAATLEAAISGVILFFLLGTTIDVGLAIYRRALVREAVETVGYQAGTTLSESLEDELRAQIQANVEPISQIQIEGRPRITFHEWCIANPGYLPGGDNNTYIDRNPHFVSLGIRLNLRVNCLFCFLWGLHQYQYYLEVPRFLPTGGTKKC